MRKFLKITLISLFFLALFIVASIFITAKLINPETVRTTITTQVKNLTGRELKIKGDIHWTYFPWLELSANQVEFANNVKNSSEAMAIAEQLHFNVKVLPLLKGNIEIEEIELVGLQTLLTVDAAGKNNWQDLANLKISTNTKNSSHFAIQNIAISKIAIKNANLQWQNQQTGKNVRLQGLNLSGKIKLKSPTSSSNKQTSLSTFLRQLTVQGNISIDQLNSTKLKAQNFKAKISANKGLVKLIGINANLYQGQLVGEATLDARNATTSFQTNEALLNVQAAPLFSDLEYTNRLSGTIKANIDIKSDDIQKFVPNLNGDASITISNGKISGINLHHALETALALVHQNNLPTMQEENVTSFSSLSGTFHIDHGNVINKDLTLTSPTLRVTGDGEANLISQQFSYYVKASINESNHQELDKLQSLMGGGIPLKISGTFSNYKVTPDSAVITKAATKLFIQKKVETLVMPGKKTGEIVKGVLQNVFQ